MDQLKQMKGTLMGVVQGQLSNIEKVDAKELGEAVDMIKDLAEASYYCAVVKAMEEREKEQKESPKEREVHHYYTEKYLTPEMQYPHYRDMDRMNGRMYYDDRSMMYPSYDRMYYGGGSSSGGSNGGNSGGSSGSSNGGGGNGTYGYQGRDSMGRFTSGSGGRHGYENEYHDSYPTEMRDYREGSSPKQRKYYMEAKEQKQDKKVQMEELEKYMKELSKDVTEMIQDASPEETMLLKQKLATLVEKIK